MDATHTMMDRILVSGDGSNRILDVESSSPHLLGHAPYQLVGQDIAVLRGPATDLEMFGNVIASQQETHCQLVLYDVDGIPRLIHVTCQPLFSRSFMKQCCLMSFESDSSLNSLSRCNGIATKASMIKFTVQDKNNTFQDDDKSQASVSKILLNSEGATRIMRPGDHSQQPRQYYCKKVETRLQQQNMPESLPLPGVLRLPKPQASSSTAMSEADFRRLRRRLCFQEAQTAARKPRGPRPPAENTDSRHASAEVPQHNHAREDQRADQSAPPWRRPPGPAEADPRPAMPQQTHSTRLDVAAWRTIKPEVRKPIRPSVPSRLPSREESESPSREESESPAAPSKIPAGASPPGPGARRTPPGRRPVAAPAIMDEAHLRRLRRRLAAGRRPGPGPVGP